MALDPTIIAGGLKLLGGLFGKKPKTISIADQMEQQALGARQAAKASGFNALTILGAVQPNAAAAMAPGSAPPLASLSVLGDIVEEKYGQDAKDRREYNRLQNELLSLEVDRARTLNVVAPVGTVSGGGAITGGVGNGRVSGPANGFLTEMDRNPALADERDNTVSYQSHGQQTVVPVGPDFDEILTGVFIDANNRAKERAAREARSPGMTKGQPLSMPTKPYGGGLGGAFFLDDPAALLPPRASWKKPKPNPKRKDLPQKRWEQKFSF